MIIPTTGFIVILQHLSGRYLCGNPYPRIESSPQQHKPAREPAPALLHLPLHSIPGRRRCSNVRPQNASLRGRPSHSPFVWPRRVRKCVFRSPPSPDSHLRRAPPLRSLPAAIPDFACPIDARQWLETPRADPSSSVEG